MKKIVQILMVFFLVLFLAGNASAVLFTFDDSAAGGQTTALIDFLVSGNTITATIDNTSPVDLIGGSSGGNSPGMTGFGFDTVPEAMVTSWTLTADTTAGAGTPVTIGSSTTGSWDWVLDTVSPIGNFSFDYIPNTFGSIDGALFNPAASSDPNNELPGGANSVNFTTAYLTITFNDTISDILAAGVRSSGRLTSK